MLGSKGKRYSPRFQFEVVLEALKGDRDAVEIARAHDLPPVMVARWKRELLENGPAVFGKDKTLATYEKRIKEMERLLGRDAWVRRSSLIPHRARSAARNAAVDREIVAR